MSPIVSTYLVIIMNQIQKKRAKKKESLIKQNESNINTTIALI